MIEKNKSVLIIFGFFTLCAVFLIEILPASWGNDAATVLAIATGEISAEGEGSYYLTARFFGVLGAFTIPMILLVGFFWAREIAEYVSNYFTLVVALLFLLPSILMAMIWPQKDFFVGIVVALIIFAFRKYSSHPKISAIFFISIVYLVYGIFMREYFLLILSVFVLMVFLRKKTELWFYLFIVISIVIISLLSQESLVRLQGSRDYANFYRGVDESQRTAFGNIYPQIGSMWQFVINYLYAFFRLNFSVFYDFSIQSIVLQVYVSAYFFLIVWGLYSRLGDQLSNLLLLFLSHVIVLPLFEPDLGSYLRHISSVSSYLIPILANLSQCFVFGNKSP